ncbi:GDP-L-galactose phosphorylase 1-like [Zingiber officinale]|uniref:GDP-L-galactose phosphorylase 1-like n=1 Tax=Zingiber officinale TaxID=94328 RepID=UPI001C4DC0AC|nr:GDP-L-galactose phosphorylase 1-like [Zingiber officinale]
MGGGEETAEAWCSRVEERRQIGIWETPGRGSSEMDMGKPKLPEKAGFALLTFFFFSFLSIPFPVERAPTQRVPIAKGLLCHGGVKISLLLNYPVRGLVYEGGTSLKDLSDVVSKSCKCLQENNIPFNVLISDSGWRIFLFPQCYAEKQALGEVSEEILETQVNPTVWEISGHMVLKRKKDFEEATEQYAWRLLAEVSLSEARFKEVEDYIFGALGLEESTKEKIKLEEKKETSFQSLAPIDRATCNLAEGCLVLQ